MLWIISGQLVDFWNGLCLQAGFVQGRILERDLPLAEESFPGIAQMYEDLGDKSLTFLQLLWIYEEAREGALQDLAADPELDLDSN
jgi:hypothetical protein